MFGLFNKTTPTPVFAPAPVPGPVPATGMLEPQSPYELKIKACSLAAEARIIRRYELRLKRRVRYTTTNTDGVLSVVAGKERPGLRDARNAATFFKLQDHRRKDLRWEARSTHLARTFLKGQEYKLAEVSPDSYPDFTKIFVMVKKYAVGDPRLVAQRYEEWKQKATEHSLQSQQARRLARAQKILAKLTETQP